MFDMTQCKVGDKLVTRDGDVLTYVEYAEHDTYPYKLDGERLYISVLPDGSEYETEYSGCDIVGFAEQRTDSTSEQLQPTNNPPTISVRKEERYFITVNDKEVEITLAELRQLYSQLYNMLEGK